MLERAPDSGIIVAAPEGKWQGARVLDGVKNKSEMKTTKSQKVKAEFLSQVSLVGWVNKPDRFGHYKVMVEVKDSEPPRSRECRLKIGTLGWRVEQKIEIPAGLYNPASTEWSGLRHGYFKDGVAKASVPVLVARKNNFYNREQ